MPKYDAIIIGSGPNGLAAAITLAQQGAKVLVLEAQPTIGGGTRTSDIFDKNLLHDHCSAVHPMGVLSPFFKNTDLAKFGLEWIYPECSVAHPLDNQPAVLLHKSIEQTAEGLGADAKSWTTVFEPLVRNGEALITDSLKPLGWPQDPITLARFGMKAMLSANFFANHWFKDDRAKALFAGCAAHSIVPFDYAFTASFGLMFAVTGHLVNWPVAKGGSANITKAMAACFESLGGEIQTNTLVKNLKDLPEAKAYIFDTDPRQLARIAANDLPQNYLSKLLKYNYGPGIFKLDWVLRQPIPWNDPNCLKASTVHIGGTMAQIAEGEAAVWQGKHHQKLYVLLAQQSQFDASRAHGGLHTGWAYCHVPNGSTQDMTDIIENQVERFAKGFKDIIVARKATNTQDFEAYNPNFVGGSIAGGSVNLPQLFARPVSLFNPYQTPNPKIFICSASTPPGGGVHGMGGYGAAQVVLRKLISK